MLVGVAMRCCRSTTLERAYAATTAWWKVWAGKLRYIEVTNAQRHVQRLLRIRHRFVPLHVYFVQAMNAMYANPEERHRLAAEPGGAHRSAGGTRRGARHQCRQRSGHQCRPPQPTRSDLTGTSLAVAELSRASQSHRSDKHVRRLAMGLALAALALGQGLARAGRNCRGPGGALSGVLASTGQQMVLGGKIYFDWVNASGGINGARIRHIVVDDAYKVDETVRLAREVLANPGVVALFGFAGTANITKLLTEGVLEAGAPWWRRTPAPNRCATRSIRYIFHVRAGYATRPSTWSTRWPPGHEPHRRDVPERWIWKAGLAGVEAAVAKRAMKLVESASYERNTDDVADAVKKMMAADPQAVIMISVNRSTAAFAKQYRAAGGGAQLYNISVVDPAELVKLAGAKAVHGLGIRAGGALSIRRQHAAVREYQTLLQKYGGGQAPSYTSFEEFLGAKVLVEGCAAPGPAPTRAKLTKALESMDNFDLGGTGSGFRHQPPGFQVCRGHRHRCQRQVACVERPIAVTPLQGRTMQPIHTTSVAPDTKSTSPNGGGDAGGHRLARSGAYRARHG